MNALFRAHLFTLLSICLLATESAAAILFEQEPCSTQDSVCVHIDPTTAFPLKLRTLAFTVPARGKALVSFHGSLICTSDNEDLAVVDLVTQIVMNQNAAPAINAPGGARHAAVLHPGPLGTSLSFNLAATTVVTVPAGLSVATFAVKSLRMDDKTACDFYNLSFSISYVEDRT